MVAAIDCLAGDIPSTANDQNNQIYFVNWLGALDIESFCRI